MTTSLGEQLGAIELAWDHEDGWTWIELAGQAWLHEARDPHTGEWIKGPAHAVGKGLERYTVPDPDRLVTTKGNKNPAEHPFFQAHPVSPTNIVAAYDQADEGTREQGRRWYSDVHDLAGYVGGGDPEKGGILLSTYSPQTAWPVNMLNAHRSVARGKPIGPGEGMMVSNDQAVKAQKAMDGMGIDELMTTAKTHSFGVLIKNGDDSPDDPYGHVVIDTHALNVAAGGNIRGDEQKKAPIGDARMHEYVADQYRQAAADISKRDGVLMKPHQLQAITWLVQQRANQARDQWLIEHGEPRQRGTAKGRMAMTKNAWGRWLDYAKANNIPLVVGTTSLAGQLLAIELDGGLGGDLLELAAWENELRNPKGEWARGIGSQLLAPGRKSQRVRPHITAAEARGNSRPVSMDEYQHLAALGNAWVDRAKRDSSPATGLDEHWEMIKADSYREARKSWGGATIDAHTGTALASDADRYAISVKPRGMHTVSVPETASETEFAAAMDRAREMFRPALERRGYHLGVFHDDEHHRIDIDPVAIVNDLHEVETVGAYTRAIGGAYHFRSGDGFWPPHVAEGADMAGDETRIHFRGPGEWHSQAVDIQEPEPDDDPDED